MKRLLSLAFVGTLCIAGCGGDDSGMRTVFGDTGAAFGHAVQTSVVMRGDTIEEVVVVIPMGVVNDAPAMGGHGTGPAGAVVSLRFPEVVRVHTFLNHFEMHWEPGGHPPPGLFDVPHFDLHFYGISESEVRAIAPGPTALPVPAPNRFPPGYPAPDEATYLANIVPEMGYHAASPEVFEPGFVFEKTLIYGFHKGELHFVEPMITKAWFLSRRSHEIAIPAPAVLRRPTLFPTRVRVTHDAGSNAYRLSFSGFVYVPGPA